MPLSTGARLGPYEIVGALGAGGMGEVYRARDTKLGREVAIKALPDQFVTHSERVARFEREAQLLAALNHPNIAAIHGLQESNGSQFLVLELVDGESLADRIARGPIGVAESLAIMRQIIDALESAHDKGIIHRDLKPGNIMLTRDERVKILDFGLAKVLEPDSAAANVSHSPTMTLGATAAGLILGTAAYMAPEQAKGRAADKRSDIWACGCVLYEMLTGNRAFTGEDVSDTLAAVLRAEPDWSALPPETPPNVRRLLKRCLEKDRRTRLGDVSTVRYVLDESAEPTGVRPAASAGRWHRPYALTAGALVAGAVAAAAVMWSVTRPAPPAVLQPVRFSITPAADRVALASPGPDVAITPDGTTVAYVTGGSTTGGLWLRRLDQLEPIQLRGVPALDLHTPAISRDGKWVAFATQSGLMKVSITGGPPISLGRLAGLRGLAWIGNEALIFATLEPATGLARIPADGGQPTILTKPDLQKSEDHVFPVALPRGHAVLFTITSPTGIDNGQIAALVLATGEQKILIRGGSFAQYAESGHLVYAAAGALRAVRFDPARLEVLSDPISIVEGVFTKATGAASFALSGNGTLVYVPGTAAGGIDAPRTAVWVNRQGVEEPIKGLPARTYLMARLSPDGSRIALDVRDQQNDIWSWDLANETMTRVTIDPATDVFPVWTRDGKGIVFSSTRAGETNNVYLQAADGTGRAERVFNSSNNQLSLSTTPDGKQLFIRDSAGQISLIDLDQKKIAAVLAAPGYRIDNATVSPNGEWLAYESTESGQNDVYVRPFPDVNSGRVQISKAGGRQPAWAPDGRELFYLDSDGYMTAVPVRTTGEFTRGAPKRLFNARYFMSQVRNYDVSRDGQRFLMIKDLASPSASAPSAPLTIVLNWFEELKARVGK